MASRGWAAEDGQKSAKAEGQANTVDEEHGSSTGSDSSQPANGSDHSVGATAQATSSEASASAANGNGNGSTNGHGTAGNGTGTGGLISVDFKDADIRQVLRIIALKSGIDIVAGNDVEGLVSIKLTNVPWEQALDVILRTYGFTFERKGNIIRVMTLGSLEKEALASEVFPLDYAKAKDVPDVIKEMLSDRGRVKFDERTNTIIVTDIPANLFQVGQVIQRLDQRTPQVLIESKVVETRLNKSENLGIDWSDSLTALVSTVSLPTTFPFPGGAGLPEFLGEFIPRAGTFSGGIPASITGGGRIPEQGGTFTFGTLSSTGLSMILNFLQSRTDTHILSNPNIMALNNQQAKIHIGSEFPVPNYSLDPTTGRTTISGYTAKNIGTVLTVTPHVNPSNEINVELKPEVISFAGLRSYDTGGTTSISLPEFTTQTAQTQVRIQSGQTIAIGGLLKKTEAKTEVKVPILGDLPIVGLLFKNMNRYGGSDPVLQDLVVFLTVKLAREEKPMQKAQAVAVATPEKGDH